MSSMIELDWASEARDEEGVLSDVIDALGPADDSSGSLATRCANVSHDACARKSARRRVVIDRHDEDRCRSGGS